MLLAQSLIAGYVAIAANIIYSIFSIPLVLSYLDKDHFGLWVLVTQVAGYFTLTELGMTNSLYRFLIEYKNTKEDGRYGAVLITGFLALGLVAISILVIGGIFSFYLPEWFKIPHQLSDEFRWLLLGQTVILSVSFGARMIGAPLYAHQRQDISQISTVGLFVIYFVFLWVGLRCGLGTYSLLLNSGLGCIWSIAVDFLACLYLGFYPKRTEWGRPSWNKFKEIFSFSRDLFMMQIGEQLASGVPTLLVSRLLGLDAVATYSICLKPFQILRTIAARPFDFSITMLCDMYILGDRERMAQRWAQIVQISGLVAGAFFATAAACNGSFVEVWTHGRTTWDDHNNWLVGLLYLVMTVCRCFSGMAGVGRHIGKLKYLYFVELTLIVAFSVLLAPRYGVGAILAIQILSLLICSTPAGVQEIARLTNWPVSKVLYQSLYPMVLILPIVFLAAGVIQHFVLKMGNSWSALFLIGGLSLTQALILLGGVGVQSETRQEVLRFAKKFIRK